MKLESVPACSDRHLIDFMNSKPANSKTTALKKAALRDDSSPLELVPWGLDYFSDVPVVLTSAFGMEGCALIDMCSKAVAAASLEPLTVACIDTDFFFKETLTLRDQLIEKYSNLNFVTWKTDVTPQQQDEQYGTELWKSSKDLCCNIRKVQPMVENIKPYKVWMTGLRRTQTEQRATTPVVSWDWRYEVTKFCPLVTWTRADVWKYVQEHDVPFNQLHLQNYPSIGCTHCTKQVPGSTPDQDKRDGRWEGNEKTECGLHYEI